VSVEQARQQVKAITGDVVRGKLIGSRRAGQHTVDELLRTTWRSTSNRETAARTGNVATMRSCCSRCSKTALAAVRRDRVKEILAAIQAKSGVGPASRCHTLLSSMFKTGMDEVD
jgi:hypothetical protein